MEENEVEVGKNTTEEAVRGPSYYLVAARERLALSQKEVADKLYLTTSFIRYIDEGEFEKFPKPAFIRGYMRSYARVVELSGDEIVKLYEAELSAREPVAEVKGVTEEKIGTGSITGPVLQVGIIGLVVLLLIFGLVWWLVSDSDEEKPRVTQLRQTGPSLDEVTATPPEFEYVFQSGASPEKGGLAGGEVFNNLDFDDDNSDVESRTPAVETINTRATDAAEQLDDPRIERVLLANSGEKGRGAKQEPTLERLVDGDRTFITVDAGGFDQIEFKFSDECWVEVAEGKHGQVYNDLNRRNDVLTLYGTAPFNILLGRAPAVEMIYNGQPFELASYISRDRTAKITIPE